MDRERVCLLMDAELAERLRVAASKETIPRTLSNFTENLLLWALPHYERAASSLWLLQQAEVSIPKGIPRPCKAGVSGRP